MSVLVDSFIIVYGWFRLAKVERGIVHCTVNKISSLKPSSLNFIEGTHLNILMFYFRLNYCKCVFYICKLS